MMTVTSDSFITMSDKCTPHHDWVAGVLTIFLICGLIISYIPQHFRIVHKGSSEGFSPWFLLLGSTSSASAMMNMVTLQWGVIKCCNVLSVYNCIEMTAGVIMVGMQWLLFSIIFVLYLKYYPSHLKYNIKWVHSDDTPVPRASFGTMTHNWKLSIALATITLTHLLFVVTTTLVLLLSSSPVKGWATFLGVSSASLAAKQYFPQLVHTFRMKLVGALSIVTMVMQSPGSVIFVVSIALRPGTNWTSWITYAVSGIMQAILLVMCISWKVRQRELGIDDFGRPLFSAGEEVEGGLEEDVRGDGGEAGEETPLLVNGVGSGGGNGKKRWFGWIHNV